jgi:hypothetical protein
MKKPRRIMPINVNDSTRVILEEEGEASLNKGPGELIGADYSKAEVG